jgi:SAM-dependent methyltransferase
MSPPEIETCRVLEVGCGRGDNLIPMAFSLPRARFLGIDLSPRQIAEGRAAIAELGLENIELRAQNILDVSPGLGSFDFIVAQGVYSWVPEPVREQMLRLCAAALAPNGLALISYNTYPGWYMRTMIRDLMVLMSLRITSLVRPAAAGPAPSLGQREDFQNFRGALALATNEPVLRVLAEAWPWSLAFETLWGRTQQRLASSWGIVAPGSPSAASPEPLAEAMLGLGMDRVGSQRFG